MLVGSVKSKQQKPFSFVNKKGFVSMYGLLLLSITLLFITVVYTKVQVYYRATKTSLTDMYIIKTGKDMIKDRLKDESEPTEEELMEAGVEETKENDTTKEEQEQTMHVTYESNQIEIVLHEDVVKASVEGPSISYVIHIQYDAKTGSILNVEYVT